MELSHANLCVDIYEYTIYAIIKKFSMQYNVYNISEHLLQSRCFLCFHTS